MTQRIPWINSIGDEMQHPALQEIVMNLFHLADGQLRPAMSWPEFQTCLSTGEVPRDVAHAEGMSRLRNSRPVILRRTASGDADIGRDLDPVYIVRGFLEDIFCALLADSRNLPALRERLITYDIVPSSGDYHDFPETYHPALRWGIWRLYGLMVLGTLPPAICLINKLPIEVFQRVVEFVCESSADRRNDAMKVTYIDQLWDVSSHLPLRLVCKSWHAMINSLPLAWSRMVQGFGGVWTERALQRSKHCDLFVKIGHRDFLQGHLLDSVHLILTHAPRFNTLAVVNVTWDALAQITSSLGNVTMSRLETVTVEAQGSNARLPVYTFANTPPYYLRNVRAVNCKLYTACSIFRSRLTSLVLVNCEVWTSLDDMLDSLRNLPSLAHFEWCMSQNSGNGVHRGAYTPESAQFLAATRHSVPIAMPNLRLVALECPAASFSALLHCLLLPAFCHIRLRDDYSLSGDKSLDLSAIERVLAALDMSLGAHISAYHSPPCGNGFQSVAINETLWFDTGCNAFMIHGSTTQELPRDHSAHQDFTPSACTFSITLLIPEIVIARNEEGIISIHPEVFHRCLHHILAWPAMRTTVQKLVTNHPILIQAQGWAPALTLVPQLTELHLGYSSALDDSSIVRGLAIALSTNSHLLPNLKRIFLGPMPCFNIPDRDALVNAMDKRRNVYGHSAISLVLVNPDEFMDEEEIDELESMLSVIGAGRVELD